MTGFGFQNDGLAATISLVGLLIWGEKANNRLGSVNGPDAR